MIYDVYMQCLSWSHTVSVYLCNYTSYTYLLWLKNETFSYRIINSWLNCVCSLICISIFWYDIAQVKYISFVFFCKNSMHSIIIGVHCENARQQTLLTLTWLLRKYCFMYYIIVGFLMNFTNSPYTSNYLGMPSVKTNSTGNLDTCHLFITILTRCG
jgi:hypothetical protein